MNARPKNITLIQAYAPTTAAEEEIIDIFYEDFEKANKSIPKSHINIMVWNFNAKVGKQNKVLQAIDPYDLGDKMMQVNASKNFVKTEN